jgi:hypothetical protein
MISKILSSGDGENRTPVQTTDRIQFYTALRFFNVFTLDYYTITILSIPGVLDSAYNVKGQPVL